MRREVGLSMSHVRESSTPAPRRGLRLSYVLLLGGLLVATGIKLVPSLARGSHAERVYRAGLDAMGRGDLAAVLVAAESLAAVPEAAGQRHVLEGCVHLRTGQLQAAIAEFRAALEDPRTAPMANMLAGESLCRNRQFRDGIAALRAATQQDPTLTDAHRRLSAVLYDLGATEAATEELLVVAQQDPTDPRPHRMRGLIFKDMESYAAAIEEYREALRRDPLLPERDEVLLELATCLLKTLQYAELEELVADSPQTADFLVLLAEAKLNQGEVAEAARLVDEALRLTPEHFESRLLKGSVELARGELTEAAATLEAILGQQTMDFRVHHKLSQVYARLGQTERARAASEEAARIRDLRARFADLHGQVSGNTDNADLRYQLGLLARQLGREDLAVSWFTAALAIDPTHTDAQSALRLADATTSESP